MMLDIKKGFILTSLATSIVLFSSNVPGYCSNNVILSAVNIEGMNDSFKITLKTDKDTAVKTNVPSSNKLILELDDTKAAELIKTSFNSASNVEDVIVQPVRNGKTRIFISGNNVSKSKIVIDSTKQPVYTDRLAADFNNTPVVKPEKQTYIENVDSNQVVSSNDFIEQNSIEDQEPDNEVVSEEPVQDTVIVDEVETTGVESSTSVDENEIVENVEESYVDSDVFKPAADLDLPESKSASTTIKNTQDSAAMAATKSFANNSSNNELPISKNWLIRFGIIFIFVTALVAYLRKENLISFKPAKLKRRKQVLNKEHLDIYRSLNKQNSLSTTHNRRTSRSKISTLDSSANKLNQNKVRKTAKPAPKANPNNKLSQHNAINNYKKQNRVLNNRVSTAKKQQPSQNNNPDSVVRTSKKSNEVTTDSINFLKEMAEMYKQSGRHDLAVNIQNNLRKSQIKM